MSGEPVLPFEAERYDVCPVCGGVPARSARRGDPPDRRVCGGCGASWRNGR